MKSLSWVWVVALCASPGWVACSSDSTGAGASVCAEGSVCAPGDPGFVLADTGSGGQGAPDGGSPYGSKDGAAATADSGVAGQDTSGGVDAGGWDAAQPPADIATGPDTSTVQDIAPAVDAVVDDAGPVPDAGPVELSTCAQLIACAGECGGDPLCATDCDKSATGEAKAQLAAFEGCSAQHCEPGSGEEYVQCMLKQCLDETAACWTGGSASCVELAECSAGCTGLGGTDTACVEDCSAAASADGFKKFVKYGNCVEAQCKTNGAFCQVAAVFSCTSEAKACGIYKGGSDCGDGLDCLQGCVDAACVLDCEMMLDEGEAKKLSALLDCIMGECGEDAGPTCVNDAAQDECKFKAFACL